MLEAFRSKVFRSTTQKTLGQATEIIAEYQEMDIGITLRQLYYRLVAKNLIKNKRNNYKRLSEILTDARYCGIVDWDAIVDRVRIPYRHSQFKDIHELVDAAKNAYRLDRWADQRYYVELATEKDAIASLLQPIVDKYHIYLNVNRGYNSCTAMYDMGKRFLYHRNRGKLPVLLYLGDHDPSGLDMVRDIDTRLKEFGSAVDVRAIALTLDQVSKYNLPPNYAKLNDSRSGWDKKTKTIRPGSYLDLYGWESWEVDAIPPDELVKMVESAIEECITDPDAIESIKEQEKRDIERLTVLDGDN